MALQFLTLTNPGGLDERSRVPSNLVVEAENLGLAHDGWLVMRPGAGGEDITGSGWTGPIQWLARHVTAAGVAELWGTAENAGPTAALARRSGGAWSTVSYSDTVNVTNLRYHHAATLNNKFFIAYDSDVNRLHVWDGTVLRRVGLDKPSAAPTVANGAGAGAASARRYRVQFLIVSGSDTQALSELSDASTAFTPAGANSAVVTRPTTPDSATHWRVYAIAGSADTYGSYKLISGNIAVGTTTYEDTVDPANYVGDAPAIVGLNIPPPSVKFLVSDGNRLVMAGAWETSGTATQTVPKPNRVWFTRVLGSSDADDESIPDTAEQTNWIDVGDGAAITGLAGPLYGDVIVFKLDSIYKLTPTGDATQPYASRLLSKFHGAIDQRCIVHGVGPSGEPAIYFCSPNFVYRIGGNGIEDISQPVARDLRASAFTAEQSFLGFDPASQQLFVNVTTGAPAFSGAYEQFTYDPRSSRWSGVNFGGTLSGWILGVSLLGINTVLGESGAFLRAAASAEAVDGVTRMFLGGQDTALATALVSWGSALAADNDASFSATVRWRGIIAEGRRVRVGNPIVTYRNPIGAAATTATLVLTLYREDGTTTTQSLTLDGQDASDPLSIRTKVFEGLEAADTYVLDIRASLSYSAGFTGEVWPGVDAIQVPYYPQERAAA